MSSVQECGEEEWDTAEMLALKFPHLVKHKGLLHRLNKRLGFLENDPDGDGSFELIALFKFFQFKTLKWGGIDHSNK